MPNGDSTRGADQAVAGRYLRAVARHAWAPTVPNISHWLSWAFALGIELGATALLRDAQVYQWELELTRLMQKSPARGWIFDVSNFVTNTLAPQFLLLFGAIIALALVRQHWRAAFLLALTFPLHVLAQFPKAIIDRPRPSSAFPGIEGVGGLQSFPSGHAEFAVTFYGLLVYFGVSRMGRPVTAVILAVWLLLVLANGFGRVSTGRHWPLDILVSYVVGAGLLSGLVWMDRALRAAARDVARDQPVAADEQTF